jgi:DNA-binding NtrC family response regulator
MSESFRGDEQILLVDDDPSIRVLYSRTLSRAGFNVETASNGREALDAIPQRRPDLVILDLVMPEQEGIETISQLQSAYPDLPVIAISGALGANEYLHVANLLGARRTLHKPITADQLLEVVKTTLNESKRP